MARIGELRRRGVVLASEADELIPADSDFPRTVDVVRREQTSAGNPSAGVDGTWAVVAGLTGLTGRVRANGSWRDRDTGHLVQLGDAERVVFILDVPAGGNGLADQVLLTDHLRFTDPTKGAAIWEVVDLRLHLRDGIALLRVKYNREDYESEDA